MGGGATDLTMDLACEGGDVVDARPRTVMLLVGREKAPELRGPVPVWSRGSKSKTGVGWEDGRDQCEHMGLKADSWRPR